MHFDIESPRGLRWVEGSDGSATLRRARPRWLIWVVGICLNGAFALAGVVNADRPKWPNLIPFGVLEMVICVALGARAFLTITTLRFDDGRLLVSST